ncbi:MAG: AEC family transporter [Rhodospirillum sp.]|nr:AEC family transporter [Rhodospirillum sp.]MCF8489139.1 AEC family transporter [Rhodospirillum sp.]MCF8502390.1 AEC family transporter [Rhodospirillum sp.]
MTALLNVALPVFGIILAGYLTGRAKLLGDHATEALNLFVFYIALPPLLFLAMARTDMKKILAWDFIAVYGLSMLGLYLLAFVLSRVLFKRTTAEAALAGMGAVFGNTGYMGIPLTITAFGEDMALPAIIATVMNSALVVGCVSALVEGATRGGQGAQVIAGHVLKSLSRNPLVIGPVAGLVVGALGLPLPVPLITFCEIIGAAAGPCALFAIGLFLVGRPLTASLGEVGLVVTLKLLALPALAFLLLPLFPGMDPDWARVLLLMTALPLGANVFVLAMKHDRWVLPSSSATLLSTVLSVATVSALLAWMGL